MSAMIIYEECGPRDSEFIDNLTVASEVHSRPDTSLKIMEDLLVVRNFFFWHTKTHIWRENGLDNHIRGAHQAYKKGWW